MSDSCVMLDMKTVILKIRDSLIFKTAQALNSNIIVQTLDFMDSLWLAYCAGWFRQETWGRVENLWGKLIN